MHIGWQLNVSFDILNTPFIMVFSYVGKILFDYLLIRMPIGRVVPMIVDLLVDTASSSAII